VSAAEIAQDTRPGTAQIPHRPLRADLAGARAAACYLYATAELINHAADLSAPVRAYAGVWRDNGSAAG
jgi:hypothetical protein